MMRQLLLLFCLFFVAVAMAQETHEITIEIEGYEQNVLSLANNVLDKQYIVDTARRDEQGRFVFRSDTNALPKGIYLVVLAPNNDYFQMVIGNDDDQKFTLKTRKEKLSDVKVTGSRENELFFNYLGFLDQQQDRSAPTRAALKDTTLTEEGKAPLIAELEAINKEVEAHQQAQVQEHPTSFVAAIINANRPNNPPAYDDITNEDDRRNAQLDWLREHYFDPINLKDDRLLRTPFLFSRINYYVDRLYIQHPDTISRAIDYVLAKMDPTSELFKYYVVHFTNKAAKSDIVGMDGVYVHMIDNYYRNGRAYWSDPEQMATMIENADKNRPLLIGKQAPNLQMSRRDGSPVNLYDLEAKYTVLYFWQFACPSCKKSTPYMKEFYAKWKSKGVEVFAVCTKQRELPKCWEYIDDNEIGEWLHATDKYQRFARDYNVISTPSIFVLDENKKIVSKRIGAQQLDELLTNLEKQRELLEAEEKSTGKR
ncbi:MAG: redoxin domain-containing protein [Lewinella sp.]